MQCVCVGGGGGGACCSPSIALVDVPYGRVSTTNQIVNKTHPPFQMHDGR